MQLRLHIPRVAPDEYDQPNVCPYAGCNGRQFKPHQRGCAKPLRDFTLDRVMAKRMRCLRCGHSFRLYPRGVGRGQQSITLQGLSVCLYVLGLSYGAIARLLAALRCPLSKTAVYHNLQSVGERAQELRSVWLKSQQDLVRLTTLDHKRARIEGPAFVAAISVNDTGGVELSLHVPDGEDTAAVERWLAEVAALALAELRPALPQTPPNIERLFPHLALAPDRFS